jgi:hypothetical protein
MKINVQLISLLEMVLNDKQETYYYIFIIIIIIVI